MKRERMVRLHVLAVLVLFASPVLALPWGQGLVGGRDLPKPVGIGIDVFSMDQGYLVDNLSFSAPGLFLTDVTGLDIENSIQHLNVKLDAWLLPFLNVYAIVGRLEGETSLDLRQAGLPLPFDSLRFGYDGLVYGGGLTLAAGGERYFGSFSVNITETDLSGDFESSVQATVLTPKLGLRGDRGAFWVGGMFIDAEESHIGSVTVPLLGLVDFDIDLNEEESFNFLVGGTVDWGEHVTVLFEGGFTNKTTVLMGLGYRF